MECAYIILNRVLEQEYPRDLEELKEKHPRIEKLKGDKLQDFVSITTLKRIFRNAEDPNNGPGRNPRLVEYVKMRRHLEEVIKKENPQLSSTEVKHMTTERFIYHFLVTPTWCDETDDMVIAYIGELTKYMLKRCQPWQSEDDLEDLVAPTIHRVLKDYDLEFIRDEMDILEDTSEEDVEGGNTQWNETTV